MPDCPTCFRPLPMRQKPGTDIFAPIPIKYAKPGGILINKLSNREAARRSFPHPGTQGEKILKFIVLCGEEGATDKEIQNALNLSNTETSRRRELTLGGWVKDSGKLRKSNSRINSIVWVAGDWVEKAKATNE